MLYDIPSISGFVELLRYAETIAPIAEVTVIIILCVSFFSFMQRYSFPKAFAPSVSIAFLTALFFFLEGMLGSYWVTALLALVGISLLILHFSEN